MGIAMGDFDAKDDYGYGQVDPAQAYGDGKLDGIRLCTEMAVKFLRANAALDRCNVVESEILCHWADEIEAGKHLVLPNGGLAK